MRYALASGFLPRPDSRLLPIGAQVVILDLPEVYTVVGYSRDGRCVIVASDGQTYELMPTTLAYLH